MCERGYPLWRRWVGGEDAVPNLHCVSYGAGLRDLGRQDREEGWASAPGRDCLGQYHCPASRSVRLLLNYLNGRRCALCG